jgi:RND family efflux transporter MFP subunit
MVELSAAVEGVIAEIGVEEGDEVKKDQILGMLDASVEKARLEQSRMKSDSQAGIDAARITLERAEEKFQRAKDLSSDRFVSPDELSDLRAQLEISRLNLQAEKEKKSQARAALDYAEALYQQRMLRSPLDATVIKRYQQPGEFVSGQPILRLAQLDPLLVEVVLPADLLGQVRAETPAEIQIDAPLNTTLPAKVERVEPVIDPASNTFAASLKLENPALRIPAGINCHVRFQIEGEEQP